MGIGFTDDKDASRSIRTGFTDRFVVSHATREVTERHFFMDESLYKGHFAWLLLIHILHFDEDTSIFLLYSIYCICLRIYFAGIFSQNFRDFFFWKGNLVNISVKCHQRKGQRGEAVKRERGCPPRHRPGVQRWMS